MSMSSWFVSLNVLYGVAPSCARNNASMLTHFHFYGISHNAKLVLLCVTLLLMTSELFLTAEIRLIQYTIQTFGVSNKKQNVFFYLAWMFIWTFYSS